MHVLLRLKNYGAQMLIAATSITSLLSPNLIEK